MCNLCQALNWRSTGGAMCSNCQREAWINEKVEVGKRLIPLFVDAVIEAIKKYDAEREQGK